VRPLSKALAGSAGLDSAGIASAQVRGLPGRRGREGLHWRDFWRRSAVRVRGRAPVERRPDEVGKEIRRRSHHGVAAAGGAPSAASIWDRSFEKSTGFGW
jgi:hypothetical protein